MHFIKKLIRVLIVLIGVSLLSFILANLSSVDPAEAIARRIYSNPTQEQIQDIRTEKGLDQPILTQYARWVGNCLRGDLGTSYQSNQPVIQEMAGKLTATLLLVGMALLWIVLITIPLGIVSAVRKDRFCDHLIRIITILGISIPAFWLGYLLLTAFAIRIPVFKVVDYGNLRSLILPSITLAASVVSSSVRMLRATILENLKKEPGILGCIILSTCNRMEIWASTGEDWKGSLYEFLCREKEKDPDEFRQYFVSRKEEEAVEHLFYLTSGLKSQILAEDQIITQVKDALALSREAYCTDNVLEVLFRMAVTAAKKVKTQVSFSRANSSVIHQAIERLENQGFSIQGKTCMVIGNGEMGKVTALALKEAGADVTVTVRQYRSGIVTIPQGCDRINYGERLEFLPKCDLAVSATASPNYTLTMEQIENAEIPGHIVLIDLAVPRDIEPSAGTLSNVTLYDIDSFKIDAVSPKLQASLDQAGKILQEQQEEFYSWYNGRDLIPRIQEIKADAVEDLNLRIMKILRKTPMEEKDRENLLNAIDTAAGKVVNKMMFGLKDFMKEEEFINCVEGLEKLYEE